MKITMMPHSGVLAYDVREYAYPVVGWLEKEVGEPDLSGDHGVRGLLLLPMVLINGEIHALDEDRVFYDLVGVGAEWQQVLAYHNASGGSGAIRYGTPAPQAGA